MKRSYGLNRQIIMILCLLITLQSITVNGVAQIRSRIGASEIKASKDTVFFEKSNTEIFGPNEQMPEFPGGESAFIEYIIQHTKYPRKAVKDSVAGKVIIRFAVQPDGSTSDIGIIRGLRQDLNQKCIKVITEMPKWKPGLQIRHNSKGYYWEPVKVWYSIPFIFTLDKKSTPKGVFIIRPK